MKQFILSWCLLMLNSFVSAQSYHFSQFFSTPLLTNPAHTGFTEGAYRVASNFRSQGNANGNTFFTGYVSADFSVLRNHITAGHKAGVGMFVMNEQTLGGAIQANSIGVSTAYNVGLDSYGEQSLGVGVQATYHHRRLDYSKLSFENQYGPGGYDPSLPVGEPLDFNSRQSFDLNAGVMYNAILYDKAFSAGVSVYNILGHRDNIWADEFKMPQRISIQTSAQFFLGEYGKLYSSLTSMHQAGASELTIGGAYGYQLTEGDKNELMGGLWYRYKDAVIPYLGYQWNGFQVGVSYDHTVSGMKTATQVRNGLELTLLYKAKDTRELKVHIPWY